ncbi:alpha/beta fold hydrolase [Cellulomonas massiliensis]|uniref:alpha/beta fold hydrolase n=1 Tax=Cellulomonas massiliensis TaxID=1465811 RepID=UPI000363F98A|nr:alpha/beta hydrolase [Cellulomonas massiliensis]
MAELRTVRSADGSTIAYERSGAGPTLVLLAGAFNDRRTCAPLAPLLEDAFTVVSVDRRGRGDSTDAIAAADVGSYEVAREVEDLDAVIAAEGGSAAVFGFSSGAILALHAAAAGSSVRALALYEAPFALGGLPAPDPAVRERLVALVAAGERGEAVATMQRDVIGLPPEAVEGARRSPYWPALEALAPTVVHDATVCAAPNVPTDAMRSLDLPVLVLAGASTWPGLRAAGRALADELRDARFLEVPGGEGHGIAVEATAHALREFLAPAGS